MKEKILKSVVLDNGYQIILELVKWDRGDFYAVQVLDTCNPYREDGSTDITIYHTTSGLDYDSSCGEFKKACRDFKNLRKNKPGESILTIEKWYEQAAAGAENMLLEQILNDLETPMDPDEFPL